MSLNHNEKENRAVNKMDREAERKGIITLKQLRSHSACEEDLKKFENHFGKQVIVTIAKAKQVADIFEWYWAAQHLLPIPLQKIVRQQVRKAKFKLMIPLYREYIDDPNPDEDYYSKKREKVEAQQHINEATIFARAYLSLRGK